MVNIVDFSQGDYKVRVVVKDGVEYFVAKDIADMLGYANPSRTINEHCKNAIKIETTKLVGANFNSMVREIILIPESDVWRLIIKSHKPEAEQIEKWIMEEVLPSIRKTGNYSLPQELPKTFAEALRAYADEVEKREQLEQKIKEDAPRVSLAESIEESIDSINIADFVRVLKAEGANIRQKSTIEYLLNSRILFRDNGILKPYAQYIDKGYFEVIEQTIFTNYGAKIALQTRITGKGQVWLADKIKKHFN